MKKRLTHLLFFILALIFTSLVLSSCGDCDHSWGDGSVKEIATCTSDGIEERTCTKCGETKEILIAAPGHKLGEETIVEPVGCLEGKKSASCLVCLETVTTAIAGEPHTVSGDGSVITAPTCTEAGVRIRICTSCRRPVEEEIPATGVHRYASDTSKLLIRRMPTASADGAYRTYCVNCHTESELPYSYADYQSAISAARSAISAIPSSAYGNATYSKMSTSAYPTPTASPTVGEHPRLLFSKDDLPTLRRAMADKENSAVAEEIIAAANSYTSGILGDLKEHSSSGGEGPKGLHNLNESILNSLMCKAFLYQISGTDLYGYEAIRLIKEYITTMQIDSSVSNQTRNWGYAIFATAIVYDWCYDLLSATDKTDLIRATEHLLARDGKMEVGFPPSGQGVVSSHGAERQILRDYLSIALAIYDEEPSWYAYIGGRFFDQYVPTRNEFYKSGMTPQGISTYVQIRYSSDLWSAWLMKSATGEIPYDAENMKEVIPSLFSRIVDGGYTVFDEGDDELKSGESILKSLAFSAAVSAYLFDDTTAASWASHLNYEYTPALYLLILRSSEVDDSGDRFENLDLITYNGGFLGETVAHSSWEEDAASVLMKLGIRTTGNHDHGDAGSFQLYYLDLLAGDSGVYDSYSSTHHNQYHRATIAHNSIVLYRNGKVFGQSVGLGADASTYEDWMSDNYLTAIQSGIAYGYADADQTKPLYVYLAGDISPAYNGNLLSADRRMLAVFGNGTTEPELYFFVYDRLTGINTTDQKTFLLHIKNEPMIEGNKVSYSSGGGQLVLQSVIGGDKIVAIGGIDNNYNVNGSQVATENGENDGYWGRVEISPSTGRVTDTMLNVIYLTDEGKPIAPIASAVQSDKVVGSVIDSTAAIFVEGAERINTAFSFTVENDGELTYYVSGVAAGEWTVSVGSSTLTATATEEGGLLTFTAPAGTLTLTPKN